MNTSPGTRGKTVMTVMTKDTVWKVERKVGAAEFLFGFWMLQVGCCRLNVADVACRRLNVEGGGVEFVGC